MFKRKSNPQLDGVKRQDLRGMSHEELEAWAWDQHELARVFYNRLNADSKTSSRPSSTDNPYGRGDKEDPPSGPDGGAEKPSPKPVNAGAPDRKTAGKQPGSKGCWRSQRIEPTGEVPHAPTRCEACGARLAPEHERRCDGAHVSLELTRGAMSLQVAATRHVYFALRCPCGHETVARPGVGPISVIEGRRRNLQMTERCLVGPMLATFIAALSVRFFMSRRKIQEFLLDWLGLELCPASIERCVHELGLASEPVVEQFVRQIRAAEIVHIDETPWYQKGNFRWLWVATTALTSVFRIASRRKEELIDLIGETFMGWMVTDGYGAYRSHPRRQRCLAHLIRKGLALATGCYDDGAVFGRDFARGLRRLIQRIHDGQNAQDPAVKRLMTRIKWNCQRNRYVDEKKVRELAGEVLNDWDAVVAFAFDPRLPPTNNDAERALRHAVIARRISYGTRTEEGSRLYAAALSLIDTCRKRGVETWAYAADLIAAARAGLPPPAMPAMPTRSAA